MAAQTEGTLKSPTAVYRGAPLYGAAVRIRPAIDADAAAVAALWTEGYTNRGPGGRRKPYAERDFLDSAGAGQVLVVEAGEGIAGVVVFYPPGAPGRAVSCEDEAELSRLVVAERARGEGVGRALVKLCSGLAAEAGATALVLWSRPYQNAAHRLYESHGYRRAPERDSTDADGQRLVFVKPLRVA